MANAKFCPILSDVKVMFQYDYAKKVFTSQKELQEHFRKLHLLPVITVSKLL